MPTIDLADPYKGSDHVIGGVWGHHVSFITPNHTLNDAVQSPVALWAHLPLDYPLQVGHVIVHRYSEHWVRFEIVTCSTDMVPVPGMILATAQVTHVWEPDGKLIWYRKSSGMLQRIRDTVARLLTTKEVQMK